MVPYWLGQTIQPETGIARRMTQKFEEEASHPIFCCAEPFLQGDLKSKKDKETIHFQCTTQTLGRLDELCRRGKFEQICGAESEGAC